MRDVITVSRAGKTFALFIPGNTDVDGARFFTQDADSFQVGMFERPKGYKVEPHSHPKRDIRQTETAECLLIQKGRARVTIFDPENKWEEIANEEVGPGDVVLLLYGGHAVEALEPLRFVEVKQGPFEGVNKTKIFRS
jgi:oxalate decarboxylase/phosphoglucose isomerase-like protein (cupin superfamily)